MVAKTKPAAPQQDFFSSVDFTTLPAKAPYWMRRQDPMERARTQLVDGIKKQLDMLRSGTVGSTRKWYQMTDHNGIYCQIRLVNKPMTLNGTSDAFHAKDIDAAINGYGAAMAVVESGQFDKLIETHLKSIPPRKPKTRKV